MPYAPSGSNTNRRRRRRRRRRISYRKYTILTLSVPKEYPPLDYIFC
jgi:hypothetical protein